MHLIDQYIYNFTKDFVSNKCCSFELSIHKISNFDIDNISWAANQRIRMISEASCDTEGWSNEAGSSTWHQRKKLQFTIDSKRKL